MTNTEGSNDQEIHVKYHSQFKLRNRQYTDYVIVSCAIGFNCVYYILG
jgi:hypothetical protein